MAKKRKSGNTKAEAEEPIKKMAKNIEEETSDESEEESEEQSSEEDSGDQQEEQNDDDDATKRETLKQLLEPFPKDQIIEFLKLAVAQKPTLIARITQSAESDPVHRNLFVFGLGWDATHDQVLAAFSQYGPVDDCKVVTDKATGRAKGFAFVIFKTRASAQKALKDKQIKVGSRMASCQLASAGPAVESTGRKIFVANVGAHVRPEAIRGFFEKFGELEEGPLGMDGVTGKFKGFAIFTYKSGEGCRKALEEPIKVFDNCRLECRKAVDGLKNSKNQNQQQQQQQPQAVVTNSGFVGGDVVGGLGYNPGFYATGLNPLMVGQSAAGFGLVSPMMAAASTLNQTGLGGNAQAALGFSGGYGINSVSPSVIGNYASQAALQGLGAYQGSQLGSSSAGSPAAVAARPQSAAFVSTGKTFPSYFGS